MKIKNINDTYLMVQKKMLESQFTHKDFFYLQKGNNINIIGSQYYAIKIPKDKFYLSGYFVPLNMTTLFNSNNDKELAEIDSYKDISVYLNTKSVSTRAVIIKNKNTKLYINKKYIDIFPIDVEYYITQENALHSAYVGIYYQNKQVGAILPISHKE